MQSEGAWVANVGVEGMNGTTRSLWVGIDRWHGGCSGWSGVGGKVNDTDEIGGQFLHVLGCRGLDYIVWGQ